MEKVNFYVPELIFHIQKSLIERDWFIHPFKLNKEEYIYEATNYLYQSENFGTQYKFYLDLNIYQYILNSYKKAESNQFQKDAIGLLIFGRFIDALFDPSYAVYEKLRYAEKCPQEILDDLSIFRSLDNAPTQTLIDFYTEKTNQIEIDNLEVINKTYYSKKLTKFKRLKNWDTFYLHALIIVSINLEKIHYSKKLEKYILWCSNDFVTSLVCLSFAINVFCENSLRKAIKFKSHLSNQEKKDTLTNMTWDIYFMDSFFREWVKKEEAKEFIFVSNDQPLKTIISDAIRIQTEGTLEPIKSKVSSTNFQLLNENILNKKTKTFNNHNGDYRQKMIDKYESTLFFD